MARGVKIDESTLSTVFHLLQNGQSQADIGCRFGRTSHWVRAIVQSYDPTTLQKKVPRKTGRPRKIDSDVDDAFLRSVVLSDTKQSLDDIAQRVQAAGCTASKGTIHRQLLKLGIKKWGNKTGSTQYARRKCGPAVWVIGEPPVAPPKTEPKEKNTFTQTDLLHPDIRRLELDIKVLKVEAKKKDAQMEELRLLHEVEVRNLREQVEKKTISLDMRVHTRLKQLCEEIPNLSAEIALLKHEISKLPLANGPNTMPHRGRRRNTLPGRTHAEQGDMLTSSILQNTLPSE